MLALVIKEVVDLGRAHFELARKLGVLLSQVEDRRLCRVVAVGVVGDSQNGGGLGRLLGRHLKGQAERDRRYRDGGAER